MNKQKVAAKTLNEMKRDNSASKLNNSSFPYCQYNSSAKKTKSSSGWGDTSTLKKFANFEDVKKEKEYNFSENFDIKQTLTQHTLISEQKNDTLYTNSINQDSCHMQSFSSIMSNQAKLTDLCPEDKQKIGELIKKLAQEKEEKDRLQRQLEENQKQYQQRLSQIYKQTEEDNTETDQISQQFQDNLEQLKEFDSSRRETYETQQKSHFDLQSQTYSNHIQNIKEQQINNNSDLYNTPQNNSRQYQEGNKENSHQMNIPQTALSSYNEQSIHNSSTKDLKKSFPLPKPPQINSSVQSNNTKKQQEIQPQLQEQVVSQVRQNNHSISQNSTQKNRDSFKKNDSDSSSSEEEDELEIAKKWRTLKKSRENSLNNSNAQINEQISQKSLDIRPSTQSLKMQTIQQKQPQVQKEEELNNKIEEKAKNINNLDVDDIKQLNQYLLQKLKQLNQQESQKDTPKFQSNQSSQKQMNSQQNHNISIPKQNKQPVMYQFDDNEDDNDDVNNDDETDNQQQYQNGDKQKQYVQQQTKKDRKLNDEYAQPQYNQYEQNDYKKSKENKNKYDHYEIKYQKQKQAQSEKNKQFKQQQYSSNDDSDDDEHAFQEQNRLDHTSQNQKQSLKNQYNNQNTNKKRDNKQIAQQSTKISKNMKQQYQFQNEEESDEEPISNNTQKQNNLLDDTDQENSELFQTINQNRNNNSLLYSGLSTPYPEKMNIEPDFLQSLKNYKMVYQIDQDEMNSTNKQNKIIQNKIPQSPSTRQPQSNTNKQQIQQRKQQNSSKEIKREVQEAIEEIDEEEAKEIIDEILSKKKRLQSQKNRNQSNNSRQNSRQSSSSKASQQRLQYQRGEFSDDEYRDEQQYQNQKQNQLNNQSTRTLFSQISQNTEHNMSCQSTSIQKKVKVDQEDVNLIHLLNDDDCEDNLLDLIQKIEEDEIVKKISKLNQHSPYKQNYHKNNQQSYQFDRSNQNKIYRNTYQY